MSMGFTSAALGISGLVFSQINDKFFKSQHDDNSTFDFLIFVGTCVAIIAFLGSFILGPIDDTSADLIQQQDDLVTHNLNNHNYTSSISSFSTSSTRFEEEDESRPLLSKNVIVSADNLSAIKKIAQQQQTIEFEEEVNISGKAFFCDPVGFALSVALLVILGLGYVYLANIGQLLVSLSPPNTSRSDAQHLRNLHVSIFSIANCGSRAVFGTLSDVLQRRAGIHRLWFFWSAAVGLVIAMTFLITSVSTPDELVSCTIMTAIVYGIAFGVAPATISEFGTKVSFCLFVCVSHNTSLSFNYRLLLAIGVYYYVLQPSAVNCSMSCLVLFTKESTRNKVQMYAMDLLALKLPFLLESSRLLFVY